MTSFVELISDPFGTTTSTGAESADPYQFTGRENDGAGLQYNRARYYSPTGARFISQDPASFEGSGTNLYWYANADPLDFPDPTGSCFDPINVAGELASGAANSIQESANQVGDWVSGAPGVAGEVGGFFSNNFDAIAAGTATTVVAGTTVAIVTACVGLTDGLAAVECLKGASPGIAATIGAYMQPMKQPKISGVAAAYKRHLPVGHAPLVAQLGSPANNSCTYRTDYPLDHARPLMGTHCYVRRDRSRLGANYQPNPPRKGLLIG